MLAVSGRMMPFHRSTSQMPVGRPMLAAAAALRPRDRLHLVARASLPGGAGRAGEAAGGGTTDRGRDARRGADVTFDCSQRPKSLISGHAATTSAATATSAARIAQRADVFADFAASSVALTSSLRSVASAFSVRFTRGVLAPRGCKENRVSSAPSPRISCFVTASSRGPLLLSPKGSFGPIAFPLCSSSSRSYREREHEARRDSPRPLLGGRAEPGAGGVMSDRVVAREAAIRTAEPHVFLVAGRDRPAVRAVGPVARHRGGLERLQRGDEDRRRKSFPATRIETTDLDRSIGSHAPSSSF